MLFVPVFSFEVKKSRLDRNELLLTGALVDVDDEASGLIGSLFAKVDKLDRSSGRPQLRRCRLNSSSFSCVSRISRAIKDSERLLLDVESGDALEDTTPGRMISSVLCRRIPLQYCAV